MCVFVPRRYFCGGSFCFMSWCLNFFVLLAPYVCFYIFSQLIGLSHIRVSTHVSTAYRDTKGTSHVRRGYVGIRSSYSSIRSSYSSYAEVLRFFMCALKNS